MKPDYLSHDDQYRRRRAMGRSGWATDASVRQTLAVIERSLSGVELPATPSMIELGCGAGDLSLHFARRGFRVTGIDIAPYAIDWAREKAGEERLDATFVVADLTREDVVLPEPTDLVLDGQCLHCIIGADRAAFLLNARKCLKRGGLFHVNTMCGAPHGSNASGYDPESRCIVQQGIARRYFGKAASILDELRAAGFQICWHEVIPAQYEGDEDCLVVNAALQGMC